MYQNNPQQSQLPFRVDAPMTQPMTIDPNRPPFAAPISAAPWLQPYIPYVTGIVMTVITNNSGKGPISMFFYNQMSMNNWQNNDFVQVVQLAADYIFLENQYSQPHPNDIGPIVQRGVQAFIDLRTMYAIRQFPALWGYIAEPDKRGIQQTHYAFEQLLQNLSNLATASPPMPQGGMMGGMMANQGVMGGQQGMYPPPPSLMMGGMMGHPGGAPVGQAYHSGQPQQPMRPMGGMSGSGRSYGTTGTTPATAPQPMTAAPQAAAVHTTQGPAMSQAPVGATPNAEPVNNVVSSKEVSWKAPANVPYPPAYNPITHKVMFQIDANGCTVPLILEGDINVIDYARHDISTIYGKPPVGCQVVNDNSAILSNLQQGITELTEEINEVDEEGDQVQYTMSKKEYIGADSLQNAITTARVDLAEEFKDDVPPMVYRRYAQIYTPVLTKKSEHELVKNLASSSSYIELREKLKAAGEEHSVELVDEMNQRATELMNHILHRRLSILPEDITVDDFVQDLDELLTVLRSNYGDNFEKIFLKDQKKNIASLFKYIDPTENKKLYMSQLDNLLGRDVGEAEPATATFVGSTVSLTLINVLSHDLQLDLTVKNVGNGLSPKKTTMLYNLAHNIFETTDKTLNIARHLVITKDGRVLEMTKGELTGGNFYLVSVEK